MAGARSIGSAWITGLWMILGAAGCLTVPDAENDAGTTSGAGTDSDSSSNGGSTGEVCLDGSRGCACYGNGTCDAGLMCLDDIACFPENCVPGTELCPCLMNGGCDVGLVCDAGVCRTETVDPTGPSTTAADTGLPTATSGELGPCDPMPVDPPCTACARSNCCDEYLACENNPSCLGVLDCIENQPWHQCVQNDPQGIEPDLEALLFCMEQAPQACGPCLPASFACYGTGEANGATMQLFDPCTECAAYNCCNELLVCAESLECQCVVDCVAQTGDVTSDCIESCAASDDPVYDALANCAIDCSGPTIGSCYPPN